MKSLTCPVQGFYLLEVSGKTLLFILLEVALHRRSRMALIRFLFDELARHDGRVLFQFKEHARPDGRVLFQFKEHARHDGRVLFRFKEHARPDGRVL